CWAPPAWRADHAGARGRRMTTGGAHPPAGAPLSLPRGGSPRPGTKGSVVAETLLPALAPAHVAGGHLRGALLVGRLHRGGLRRPLGALGLRLLTVTVLVLGHGDASCGDLGARAGTRFTYPDKQCMLDNYRA